MYVARLNLNMLTATIAAIAIGVGIDFSIHFTERFRQEKSIKTDKHESLIAASRTTGTALFGTALSTALGFTVIAFAPMPIISTFGMLTAVMIALSFLMTLLVLPSLLMLFNPSTK
jgi:predicted RND superfamily exporter protein